MEDAGRQESDYSRVIETLIETFGEVVSEDVVHAVVENCGGNLNESADAIMSLTLDSKSHISSSNTKHNSNIEQPPNLNMDGDSMKDMGEVPEKKCHSQSYNKCEVSHKQNRINKPSNLSTEANVQPSISYARASQGEAPQTQKGKQIMPTTNAGFNIWTNQFREILSHHNKGSRLLIIMRGAPGSGKSFLAKQIIEMTVGANFSNYKKHILSTDDYFMVRGVYQFEKSKLSDAHIWNQSRARTAMMRGLSPVIIDNTNIELWEMEPYVRDAVRNGYVIEVLEPNTPWAKKANQLSRKNIHGVPFQSIKRMLDNFQNGVTGEYLRNYYRLCYPENMVPPVLRNFPPMPVEIPVEPTLGKNNSSPVTDRNNESITQESLPVQTQDVISNTSSCTESEELSQDSTSKSDNSQIVEKENENRNSLPIQYTYIEEQLEEYAKVENEWENGENWEEETEKTQNNTKIDDLKKQNEIVKPKRRPKDSVESQSIQNSLPECQDWTKISMFMPPWESEDVKSNVNPAISVEKVCSSTCMEIGDTDINNSSKPHKIITAIPRDINLYYLPLDKVKIPDKRMLDKSTMTNDQAIIEGYRCQNEEKHFRAFRKLFKNINKCDLRDIFDRCCGDVNWAVDIVLDGVANKQLLIQDEDDSSDIEEEISGQCECVAAYNVIPDVISASSTKEDHTSEAVVENVTSTPRKVKKEVVITESSIQLKRQIEKNVVIADNHYSEHCLKIRKIRRGEASQAEVNVCENVENSDNTQNFENVFPSTSKVGSEVNYLDTENVEHDNLNTESDDDDETGFDYVEKTVNIELGSHFVTQLDEFFGRRGMIYPENIIPKINIPLSILNEINALWMESLMDQLDKVTKQTQLMVLQDEEFARQLALKEEELALAGKEPEVPDFKEIMDLDFALSLYQKDVEEWRNKEPNDLAAKLTREKLYNLFPDISPNVLSELLMAYDNNFQATVEVLLMSTGQTRVLEMENGINKFVMKKEIQRQGKLLKEQKKALSEVEWPFLPRVDTVDMSIVEKYRDEAEQHLARRNLSYQKAQDYIQRGMTQVAAYYSELAALHKQKYEQANSLAAASLIQVHASNNPDNSTIDLHYLRVGEARESLDLFLDAHIQKLREIQHRSNLRHQNLYFITGRGLHSNGRPRVKPAIKKRLQERNLAFSERNPGLLAARVSADDKLSHQIG
ncbi:unnamed protein product [Parnassius apollo]|uniref:(apollo) hypothetical protein n=1 Tax=Parnassius apollo TaxID=110799 RepID=A0A8S3XJZ9_PARAO|nr:unnamed protein product [Parnassius apollo]